MGEHPIGWWPSKGALDAFFAREVELCRAVRAQAQAKGCSLRQHETLFSQRTWNLASRS